MTVKALCRWMVIVMLVATVPAGAQESSDGIAVVEQLHRALTEAMTKGDALGFAGRVALLEPVITDSFNFDTIARIVTGRYWKQVSAAERQQFIDVFKRLSVATYASNFSSFSGEQFETIGAEENDKSLVVRTALVQQDGDRVSLNYLLHRDNGSWRIVNVIAQGVSDLSLKRADYTAVIKAEGFDSLIERLEDKTAEMSEAP